MQMQGLGLREGTEVARGHLGPSRAWLPSVSGLTQASLAWWSHLLFPPPTASEATGRSAALAQLSGRCQAGREGATEGAAHTILPLL